MRRQSDDSDAAGGEMPPFFGIGHGLAYITSCYFVRVDELAWPSDDLMVLSYHAFLGSKMCLKSCSKSERQRLGRAAYVAESGRQPSTPRRLSHPTLTAVAMV